MKKYFETLNEISTLLNENIEFNTLMSKVLEILASKLSMQRGIISIYRQDLEEIHVDVTYGIPEKKDKIFYRLGEGITGKVVATGRPVAIPHLDKEPLFLDRSGARKEFDRSELAFICVPIKYGYEIVGALSVDRIANESDLKIEVVFLEIVANLLASKVYIRRIQEDNYKLKETIKRHSPIGTIVGNSEIMREVAYLISQVADTDSTVLITGETGTGKGLVASEIHYMSRRSNGPFIKINCGAIPESLMESELFGHERGSFTGAFDRKIGKFEIAKDGTIFLDEIGEIPVALQVKLLRVLEDKKFERIGGNKTVYSNVRVIAATNKNLEKEIKLNNFRADLYYRLNVFPIHLPPLRERGSDIIMLADYFVQNISKQMKKSIRGIDNSAVELLLSYNWPGNVRELQNCIERAILMNRDGLIKPLDLPPSLQANSVAFDKKYKGSFEALVSSYEKSLIIEALRESGGSQAKASQLLGTTKRIIQYKIKKYGIDYLKFRRKSHG